MSNIDKQAQGEKTREAFERWAEQSGALPWGILKKHRNQDGTYPGPHYTYMWHAWNACHQALLDELEAEQRISTTWRKTAESNREKLEAADKRIDEQREIMRQAASDISYAIFNLTGSDLSRLNPSVVETTDPTDTALIAERNLRAAAAGKGE